MGKGDCDRCEAALLALHAELLGLERSGPYGQAVAMRIRREVGEALSEIDRENLIDASGSR